MFSFQGTSPEAAESGKCQTSAGKTQNAFLRTEFSPANFVRVGVDCDEGPPVPIPNTEVKLTYAENT